MITPYAIVEIQLRGIRPLLLHSSQAMNPKSAINIVSAPIKGRRGKNKTDMVIASLEKVDWLGSGVWNRVGKPKLDGDFFSWDGYGDPALPVEYIIRCAQAAGTATKRGTLIKQAVTEHLETNAVFWDIPATDATDMWEDPESFVDIRSVVVQRQRIMRTRLRIPEGWSITTQVIVDTSQLDVSEFRNILMDAGRRIGTGDYRPKFGKFTIERLETVGTL
jgi:hypothetical protein